MARQRKSFKTEGGKGYPHREHRSKKNRKKRPWDFETIRDYKRKKNRMKNEHE